MKVTIHVEVASVSVTTEPGVVSIFPMRDKKNPIGLLVKLKQLGVLCRHGGGDLRIALHRLGDEADFAFLLGRIERRGVERAEGADRLRVVRLLRLLEPEPRRRQGIQSRESSRPAGRTLRTTGIQERLNRLDGHMDITSTPGSGTCVTITIRSCRKQES